MSRLIVLSIVAGLIVVPVMAARDPNPVRGLRHALFGSGLFFAVYLFALLVLYPRL